MVPGTSLPKVFGSCKATALVTFNTMAAVFLDNQIFYTPPVVASPELTNRSVLARIADPSGAISGAPLHRVPLHPLPLQGAPDFRHGDPGDSPNNAVLISDGGSDFDDSDDDRSNTTFPPLEAFPSAPHNGVQSNSVAGTDKDVNATPSTSGDSNAKEPSVTGGADPDDISASPQQQQSRSLEYSPAPLSASPRTLHTEQDQPAPTSGRSLQCAGISCQQGLGCPRHPRLSAMYQRVRDRAIGDAESSKAREDDPPCHPRSPHGGLPDNSETDDLNGGSQPHEDVCPTEPGDDENCLRPARNKDRDSTLRCESANEGDSGGGEGKLANAKLAMQPPLSQAPISPQRVIGSRRHRDTNDGEDYRPVEDNDAEHSQDDVVRPLRRKRRRANASTVTTGGTAAQQQTHQYRADPPLRQIRKPSRPLKRWSQRSISSPPSPWRSTLEEETAKAPVAKFEEWPLGNAVFKRATLNGVPTFQLQFTWDPCAEHREGHRVTQDRSSASPARRHCSARQKSTRFTTGNDTTANSKPTLRRARYTPQDDAKICQLKEQGLSWPAIAEHFPGRTPGAIEVRYHTKLKTTNPSRSEAPQLFDRHQPSPVVGDASEEEWEVEEICDDRKLDESSVELLVKWKGGEETWEPYEMVAETEALDKYERLHGLVGLNSV